MGRFSNLETGKKTPAGKAEAKRKGTDSPESRIGATLPSSEEPTYDAPYYMSRGDRAFFVGDQKDALRWYSKAMQTDSAFLDAWIEHIRVLTLTRQLAEAKVWINRALSVFPEAPGLLALRSVNMAQSGQMKQAMSSSDMLLSKRDEDWNAWLARGHILLMNGNKNAPFCFDQAEKAGPTEDWRVPFVIGFTLELERQWARAIARYDTALERRPTLPYAWYRIGRCQATLGHRDAARKAFGQAEELCGEDENLRRKILSADTGSVFSRLRGIFGRGRRG